MTDKSRPFRASNSNDTYGMRFENSFRPEHTRKEYGLIGDAGMVTYCYQRLSFDQQKFRKTGHVLK